MGGKYTKKAKNLIDFYELASKQIKQNFEQQHRETFDDKVW